MAYSSRKNYSEESRLPLDLRTVVLQFPEQAITDFLAVQDVTTRKKFVYSNLQRKGSAVFFNFQYYLKTKKKQLKTITNGSLVCAVIASKSTLLSLSNHSAYSGFSYETSPATPDAIVESYQWPSDYRTVFGHCIQKKQKQLTLFVSSSLVGSWVFFKINLAAPNVLAFADVSTFRFGKSKRKQLEILKFLSKRKSKAAYWFKVNEVRERYKGFKKRQQ